MNKFVRRVRAKNLGRLKLHDPEILVKMWLVVQSTEDEQLRDTFMGLLSALNISFDEVGNCLRLAETNSDTFSPLDTQLNAQNSSYLELDAIA